MNDLRTEPEAMRDSLQNEVEDLKGYDIQLKVAQMVADEWLKYYDPIPVPIDMPEILREYRNSSEYEKSQFSKSHEGWIFEKNISDFLRRESSAISENNSNTYWLKYWADVLSDDPIRQTAILRKINKYTNKDTEVDWED